MKKGQISNLLRGFRLIYCADKVRFYIQKAKNWKANQVFIQENPGVALPPDYLIYESFQINYQKYYTESIETAQWLTKHFSKHIELDKVDVLDWGCGPGRIIRHMPQVIGNTSNFFGTDYNQKSIDWCKKYLPGIQFNNNTLQAKLPYGNDSMDVIYGISVFTHLSERLHFDWYNELFRILKPNGIMFLTTQGNNFKEKLTEQELDQFNKHKLVIRGKVKEGHRTYSAFHPPAFMLKLFGNAQVLEHIEQIPVSDKWLPQDIWIVRKNKV